MKNEKLDAALAAYEKERPITNDAELEAALVSIIESDLKKEDCDKELVDAVADELLLLRGEDPGRVRAGADKRAEERFPEMMKTAGKEKARGRVKIGVALIAAAIAAVTAAVLFAFSFGVSSPPAAVGEPSDTAPAAVEPTDTVPSVTESAPTVSEPVETEPAEHGGSGSYAADNSGASVLWPEGGAGVDFYLIYGGVEFGEGVAEADGLPSTLPVYYDRYGNGQGGPMVDFTDEEEASLYRKAHDDVAEFFGEETASNMLLTFELESEFGDVYLLIYSFTDGADGLSEDISGVTVTNDSFLLKVLADKIPEGDTDGVIENEYVAHALRYAGIKSPVAYWTDKGGAYSSYMITDDIAKGTSPARVEIVRMENHWNVWIEQTGGEVVGEYSVIPYDDALSAARSFVKEQTGEDLPLAGTALIYEKRVAREGALGSAYIVPVYRFFFEGTENGTVRYGAVNVTAADFTPAVRR